MITYLKFLIIIVYTNIIYLVTLEIFYKLNAVLNIISILWKTIIVDQKHK